MARLLDSKYTETLTATATSAITTRHQFVKFDTDESNVVLSGAGGQAVGVNITTAAAGERISVVTAGIVRVHLGGTVTDQSFVQSDASGNAVQGAAGYILGYMPVGGAVGEERSIFLFRQPTGGVVVGAAVASAAAIVPTGTVFHVTGTTSITSITATAVRAGAVLTLIFDGILTFTDGNNLVLAGNMTTSADDTITLAYDGTNFYEIARSAN